MPQLSSTSDRDTTVCSDDLSSAQLEDTLCTRAHNGGLVYNCFCLSSFLLACFLLFGQYLLMS